MVETRLKARLAYTSTGASDGPALVLLHSIATSHEMWRMSSPLWETWLRVIAVDLPGHGSSPASWADESMSSMSSAVIGVLDALGIRRASVAGLSLGGMVAQAMAIEHPERVSALVLANTLAHTPEAGRSLWDARIAAVRAGGMESQVDATLDRWFTPAFRSSYPRTVAWVARQIRATRPAGFIAAAEAIRQLDHRDALAAIKVPALIIAGLQDRGATPAIGEAMAGQIKGARFQVIKSAHLSAVEKPLELAEVIDDFLARAL